MPAEIVMLPELSDDDQKRLEWLLVEFDLNWRSDSLAEHASRINAASPLRARALVELVKVDMERQWGAGQAATVESYLSTYPELGTPETVSAELIHAEFQVRRQFGEPAEVDDVCGRFPRQAAELRRLIDESKQVVSDTELAETGSSTVSSYRSAGDTLPGAGIHEAATQPPSDTADSRESGTPADASSLGQIPQDFGRYRIVKCIGRGGMGAVYLAHDTELDRRVALKIPHFGADAGPEVLERFYRESRAAATLDHPGICPVYDFGRIGGVHYLVMAYIEGDALSERIKSGAAVADREAATIIRKLALALQEAHEHGACRSDRAGIGHVGPCECRASEAEPCSAAAERGAQQDCSAPCSRNGRPRQTGTHVERKESVRPRARRRVRVRGAG